MSQVHSSKRRALREQGSLNPHPEQVTDGLFHDSPFFDPRDRVLAKYEMLRRVRVDGFSITKAALASGFSRPAFYQAQAAFQQNGLPGLMPKRPGPLRAHKLSGTVMEFVEDLLLEDSTLDASILVAEHSATQHLAEEVRRSAASAKQRPQFVEPAERNRGLSSQGHCCVVAHRLGTECVPIPDCPSTCEEAPLRLPLRGAGGHTPAPGNQECMAGQYSEIRPWPHRERNTK